MPGENILVIAVDGLRAASLGAYGNTSYSTSALDELAAESFLCDECFADAVELPQIYRSLWQSVPSQRSGASTTDSSALPRLLRERGYATTLLTDEFSIAGLPNTAEFDDLVQLTDAAPTRADDISQTSLARLFTAACDEIQSSGARRMIWLHARGLYGPWDAPLDLQEPLLAREEGDPPPSDALEPPDVVLDDTHDPDTAFRWSCAYAAQVMVLDACIAALRDAIEQSPEKWLVVLLGVRGFPLGEHGQVGGVVGRLFAEQLHVPMLWRFPDGTGRLARSGQLASLADLVPTLLDWIDGDATVKPSSFYGISLLPRVRFADSPPRNELIAVGGNGTKVIRTSDWTLRRAGDAAADSPCELFVRPDDRWEANDVASLCPDVVDDLTRRLADAIASTSAVAESP